MTSLVFGYDFKTNDPTNMESDDYNNLMKQAIEDGIISTDVWGEQAKLLSADGESDDRFGDSVSIDGDYAIIGVWGDDDNGDMSGSAYVFTRSGTAWTQHAKLLPSDGAAFDFFGDSVSIEGDYTIIGAPLDDDNGDYTGSAYVFIRSGSSWTEQQKLLASDGVADDCFGYSVSISGGYAIIGAFSDDDSENGSAYVFTRSGTVWTEQVKLIASDGAFKDNFGWSVSIDGDYAIIGSPSDDDNGVNSGSAYVFTRSGTVWTEQAKLLASDGTADDVFGCSVSIDGDYVIIGARLDDENVGWCGSAYVFNRSGSSWTEQQKLLASDGAADDVFGASVSISGGYAVIGAPLDDDNGDRSGSAYIFITRDENLPPETPDIDGPTEGNIGEPYDYTFVTIDLDGDNVWYYVEWGDDNSSGWLGPYPSGQEVVIGHTWERRGTYEIKAKARDIFEDESDWAYLEVTMPVNQHSYSFPLLQRLLELFPNMFPILRNLLDIGINK